MVMADEPQITHLSVRAIVRQMFEALSENLDEFSLPAITDRVFDRVKGDPDLLARVLEESARPLVYDIGLSVLASQRARRSRSAPVLDAIRSLPTPSPVARSTPSLPLPTDQPRRQAPSRPGFDWLRQPVAVAPSQTIRLRAAVKGDLERAIRFGGQGIVSTRVSLAYYELIKDGLASDAQAVADRYTDADLAYLWQRAERRIASEDRVMEEVKERINAQRHAALAVPQPAS